MKCKNVNAITGRVVVALFDLFANALLVLLFWREVRAAGQNVVQEGALALLQSIQAVKDDDSLKLQKKKDAVLASELQRVSDAQVLLLDKSQQVGELIRNEQLRPSLHPVRRKNGWFIGVRKWMGWR